MIKHELTSLHETLFQLISNRNNVYIKDVAVQRLNKQNVEAISGN